ncbi:MAG: sigma 54-interacting transcriptional regulator [Myxococcales bacterium]|nr:sigma 54-interacting transcriptional regulator [Myxococcales bacterium]
MHPRGLRWSQALDESPTIIGRIESPEVARGLGHGTVSRRHLELRWDAAEGRYWGRDLGSHNGSRVDGRELDVSRVPLSDGSILRLGDVCLVLERLEPGTEEAAIPPALLDTRTIPGSSPSTLALRRRIAEAAPRVEPVLLRGETGTGKQGVARELHRLGRPDGPWVAVPCATLEPRSIEQRLIGTPERPGALWTTTGGTVLLDELAALPPSLQPALLRALRGAPHRPAGHGAIPGDLRLVVTSVADLEQRVAEGLLSRDLHATLARTEIRVPPLRERRGDALEWLERFHAAWLDEHPGHPGDPLTLSPRTADALLRHDWPGNLDELRRLVDELASSPSLPRPITLDRLPAWLHRAVPPPSDPRETMPITPLPD